MSPPEGRYTKIAAIAGVVGLFIALLAWIHPFAPRSDTPALDTGITTKSSVPTVQPVPGAKPLEPLAHGESSDESRLSDFGKPSTDGDPDATLTSGREVRALPSRLDPKIPARACEAPETATLRAGTPVQVASGLAVLSVRKAREGSESFLTLGIASDRETLSEAVLGAPTQIHFKTSRGTYFVSVAEADLAVGAITVLVGCEAMENTL